MLCYVITENLIEFYMYMEGKKGHIFNNQYITKKLRKTQGKI